MVGCGTKAVLLLTLCVGAASAQLRAGARHAAPVPAGSRSSEPHSQGPQLLTFEEGLAVLGAALESRHHKTTVSDCSHLVNAIYAQAGFAYTYANSSQLYAGVSQFQRVTSPQPGDLVVWPAHTGIMINPAQHSFFSALRSGHGVEIYDAPYWKAKGRPRFLRYVKATPPPALSAATRKSKPNPTILRPAVLRKAGSVAPGPPARDLPSQPEKSALGSAAGPEGPPLPRIETVKAALPGPEHVSCALGQIFSSVEESLKGQDIFALHQSLVAFDQITVKTVSLKGNQGWADVTISGLSPLAGNNANLQRRAEQQRWPLTRRDTDQWELILPLDTIYLPRERAARVLAHQLAALTDDSSPSARNPEKKAELARLLDELLKH